MSLSLSSYHKDLGRIKFDSVNTMLFRIMNDGDFPVEVPVLSKGCGKCTSVSVEGGEAVIPAHSFIQIRVVFKPTSMGINKKWVSAGDLKFTFEANVV